MPDHGTSTDAVQAVVKAKIPTHGGARWLSSADAPPLPPRSKHGNKQEHTKYNEEEEARDPLAHLHLWRQLGCCGEAKSAAGEETSQMRWKWKGHTKSTHPVRGRAIPPKTRDS